MAITAEEHKFVTRVTAIWSRLRERGVTVWCDDGGDDDG